MSDERQKNEVIDYLYGELDEGRVRALLRDAEADPELASDLRTLQATRVLYQQVELPEPPAMLSEAILRQEKILRAQPESFWAPLVRLFMHPAFGAAGIVVVAVGAGLVYTLSQPPAPATLTGAAPAPVATVAVSPPPPGAAEKLVPASPGAMGKAGGLREVEFAPEEARAAGDVGQPVADEVRQVPLKQAQAIAGERDLTTESPDERADDKDVVGGRKQQRSALSKKKSAPAVATDGFEQRAEPSAEPAGGFARPSNTAQPSTPVPQDLAYGDLATTAAQVESKAGSGGQLTSPNALDQETAPAMPKELSGSAGNVANRDPILFPDGASEAGDGTSGVEQQQAKPRRIPVGKGKTSTAAGREIGAAQAARISQRAKDAFDAGLVAYDSRRYLEAYDLFKQAEQHDVGKKLAPAPQVYQARALYDYKMWPDSAAIMEKVLDDFPKFEGRDRLYKLLEVCYQQIKDDAKLSSVRARRAREADRSKAIQAASPVDEPANPTPAAH